MSEVFPVQCSDVWIKVSLNVRCSASITDLWHKDLINTFRWFYKILADTSDIWIFSLSLILVQATDPKNPRLVGALVPFKRTRDGITHSFLVFCGTFDKNRKTAVCFKCSSAPYTDLEVIQHIFWYTLIDANTHTHTHTRTHTHTMHHRNRGKNKGALRANNNNKKKLFRTLKDA